MKSITAIANRLHDRLGDFWWYSLLLFVALRIGDVINAFVGLWLVPKYVPQEELGAVLPLTQLASFFGLPLGILVTVFTKFVNKYKTLGEEGKVKSLLRWFIGFTIIFTCISSASSFLLLPHFFERIRVVSGSLGFLIVAAGIVGSISPVFSNALQGLKKFNALTVQNLLSAPLRLATMLVAVPYRALSGYMLGQISAPVFTIAWAIFNLRKEIRSSIVSVPFWKSDLKETLKFIWYITIWYGTGAPCATIISIIIRQRLTETESAAYYMISRFAEFGTYAGVTMMTILFPLVAEAHTRGNNTSKILRNSNIGTVAFGMATSVALYFLGKPIFLLLPSCTPYVDFIPDMTILCLTLVIGQVWNNYTSHELACERFRFLSYGTALTIMQMLVLVCFTGYAFFDGILPVAVVNWMQSVHLNTLRNILWFQFYIGILRLLLAFTECKIRQKRHKPSL